MAAASGSLGFNVHASVIIPLDVIFKSKSFINFGVASFSLVLTDPLTSVQTNVALTGFLPEATIV